MRYLADSAKKVDPSRLRAFELFAGFSEDDLARIAEVCAEATVPSGSVLIREGQVGTDVFLLEEGVVNVYRGETSAAGILANLQAPTLFGERALVDPERIRTASVEAASDLRLLTIRINAFLSILQSFPLAKENLRQLLAARAGSLTSKRTD